MSLLAGVNEASVGEYYFALRNDPSLNNAAWSTFPAISTIDASGNAILNTITVEIDGQFLTADANDLLLNGVPIATINNLSDIADWSLYPSLSGGVDMATYSIRNISGLSFIGGNVLKATGGKALVNGQDVVRLWSQCNALVDVNMGGHFLTNVGTGLGTIKTGNDNNILVNDIDVVTKWSDFPAQSNVDMGANGINNATAIQTSTLVLDNQNITATTSDLYVNGIPVGSEWSTLPAISDVSMAQHSLQDVSSISFIYGPSASVLLNASGGFLYANGVQLAEGTSVNEWSRQPAVSDVNMNSHSISGAYKLFLNGDLNIDPAQNVLKVYGASKFYGGVEMFSSFNSVSPSFVSSPLIPFVTIPVLTVGGQLTVGTSNSTNVYGAPVYVYGGGTLDGGVTNGWSIGCLPALGINTQRIDVLPIGINAASATYIALAPLGAGSFTCGGALALAAGSYVTLEHGFGLGSKGVFVQDAARNDEARLIFEFGGSVGNSVDTSSADNARMQFFGTDLFVSNIAPNTARWPRLPYLNIQSVSSLTFYSGPSGGGASIIAGPSGALTISGKVSIPSLTISGLGLNGDLNMNYYDINNVNAVRTQCNLCYSNVCTDAYSVHVYTDNFACAYIQTLSYGVPIYNAANIYCSNDAFGNPCGLFTDLFGSAFTPVVSLSGRLAFASSVSAGQSTASTIAAGTGGVALILGGKTQINGDLDMTNHVLSNVAGATMCNVVMKGNLNMSNFSIDNTNSIATRYITGNGGLSLNGTDLDFANRKGTNLADPTADTDVANKQYVDAQNPANSNENSITNLYVPTPSIVATTSIVLPQPSCIYSTGTMVVSNAGPDTRRAFLYVSVDGNCNAPVASSVYSNDLLTLPAQNLTGVLSAGSHTVRLLAYPDVSNSTLTSAYANIICTAGFS